MTEQKTTIVTSISFTPDVLAMLDQCVVSVGINRSAILDEILREYFELPSRGLKRNAMAPKTGMKIWQPLP